MLMDFMRRNTKNFLIALIILIIPAFIYWGSSAPSFGRGKDESGVLLEIGKQKVTVEAFEQRYRQLREMARANMGASYSPEIEKLLNLKQQALDGMIQEILFEREAKRLKIVVSDQEIQDSLKQNPYFQTDGVFDPAKWNAAIRDTRHDWPSIIEQEREALRNKKIIESAYAGARVTEEEIKDEFRRQNEQAKIRYVTISAGDYLDKAKLSDDDLKAYYEQHKTEYTEPAQVRLDYVELKKEPSEMDFADMEAFVKSRLELAKGDADFAELARNYSDDPATKNNGGDLGFFKKGNPRAKDIEKAAFALKPGEISDVIETAEGFHIIKVEETKGSGDKKEVRARDIYFKVRPSDDTTLSLEERASGISYKAQGSSLKETAKAANVELMSTHLFVESSPVIPVLGRVPEVSKVIPGLEDGAVSNVIETEKAFYIVQVVERKPARVPELSEVKNRIESAARAQKALDLAKAKAEELVKQVNEQGKQLKDVAKAREALPFTRRGYPPELPRVEGLVEAVFSLKDGMAAGPFADSKVACVVQLQKKIEPDEAAFEGQKQGIEQRILAQRKQELYKEYYEDLKQTAGVKINQALLDSV